MEETQASFRDICIEGIQEGFPINASVEFDFKYYGHKLTCAKTQVFLCTEEGTGNCKIYPFPSDVSCMAAASKLWCSWVAMDMDAREIGSGGMGFARNTIRYNCSKYIAENLHKATS